MTIFGPRVLDGHHALELQRARARVEPHICEYFASAVRDSARWGASYERLWRICEEQVCGGKLIRPALFICAFESFTSREAGPAEFDIAAAIELLHFSFLLHDDVIDGDLMRRGKPNFIAQVAAEAPVGVSGEARLHWARSAAILMGDLLLSQVHRTIALTDIDAHRRQELVDLLDHTIVASVAGELVDVELSDGITHGSMDVVLQTSLRKTATYTFEFPLRAAAIVTGADSAVQEVFARVASHLGLAFQLQDDVLSVFGDEQTHGKDFCSDLREGKITALIAHARDTPFWDEIEPALHRADLGPADAERIRGILARSGSADHVNALIDGELAALHSLLDDSAPLIPAGIASLVRGTAEGLRGRSV